MKNKLEKLGLEFDDLFYERCEKFTALLQQWELIKKCQF